MLGHGHSIGDPFSQDTAEVAAEVAAWAKKSLALREANSRELEAAAAGSANENARAEEEARAPVVEQASHAHTPEELPALGPSLAAADAEPAPSDAAAAGGEAGEEAEEEEEAPRVAKQVPRVTRGRKRYRGFRYEARQDTRQARRRQPKVVVVGAGFAGVAAAARLQKEYGYQVELLEARGRIGGRVHSLLDGEGTTVELGAAVLMGTRGHPLATLCRKHSVRMERLEPSCPLHDSETGRQLPPELDARVESLFNDALDSASAAARAPHASALFAYEGAELEVESRGEWRRAVVVARRTGTPRRGPSHGAASSSSSPPGATPPTADPPPVVDEAAEAAAAVEVEVSARVTRVSPVPPPVLTAAAAAAAAGEPPRRRADSEYSSETPPTLPSPGEPDADLPSEALVRYVPLAEGRAAPGKGRAEEEVVEEVVEWIALPSARLRPPALETALAGALRARRAASAADDLGGEEMAGAAERALQWHLANLEFACAASLGNVSAAEWDQDDAFDYEGDHVLLPEGGYQGLLHRLADGVEARCGITVTGIEMRDNPSGIRAVCKESNEVIAADALVLTVPLGVLQTPPEAGGIRFTPPLPHRKLDALGRLGFGLLNKAAPPRPPPPAREATPAPLRRRSRSGLTPPSGADTPTSSAALSPTRKTAAFSSSFSICTASLASRSCLASSPAAPPSASRSSTTSRPSKPPSARCEACSARPCPSRASTSSLGGAPTRTRAAHTRTSRPARAARTTPSPPSRWAASSSSPASTRAWSTQRRWSAPT